MIPLPTVYYEKIPRIQHVFEPESNEQRRLRQSRQIQIKKAFEHCWTTYKKYAWLHDEVAPLSGGFRDRFGGWAATLVDSLDTLYIMGMWEEFRNGVDAVTTVDFGNTTVETVSIFETTIRHLGGLLSAYDLSGDRRLLVKAIELGDMLYRSFDTPNRMPVTRWNYGKAMRGESQLPGERALLAEIGSLTMEFFHLSQLSNDPIWFDAVQRVIIALEHQQTMTKLPGMWPTIINAREMNFTNGEGFGLGPMADSFYEYLPKMYLLSGGTLPIYRKMYEQAMATSTDTFFFRPMTPDSADILVTGSVYMTASGPQLKPEGEHLVNFVAGMLALSSKIFSTTAHLDIAQKLVDGIVWIYAAFPLGIMPESFTMIPCNTMNKCAWDEEIWKLEIQKLLSLKLSDVPLASVEESKLPPGFTSVSDPRYLLRPEAIESLFVLYRITGQRDLLEKAWDMFSSIQQYTETHLANAAIADVTITDGGVPQLDTMESFWLAETLKYFYLIFSEPTLISLDEWVFNTEAHPFKRLI
ncbi:glycoside hydrolase family 47 protein [Glonium stellatum]|uniref:alpha-1,2-Mannosidase n=1 Tax=Glonium stellatum TaxID=574774 RepID=A0A8E2F313_9PEZI|nr:glycoside hydrolase family 47 protein [Glonium stellatum]